MHIGLRIIALSLFSGHAHTSHSRKHTPDSKTEMFALLSNIYRWKIYSWPVLGVTQYKKRELRNFFLKYFFLI